MKEDMKKILAMSQFYGTSQCERKCKVLPQGWRWLVLTVLSVDTPSLGYVVLAEISLEPGQAGTVEGLGGGEALSDTHRGGGWSGLRTSSVAQKAARLV